MFVKILPNDRGNPPGKLADAEIHFTDGATEAWGPLTGLKLIGFAVWEVRGGTGKRNVTFPARQYLRQRGEAQLRAAPPHRRPQRAGKGPAAHSRRVRGTREGKRLAGNEAQLSLEAQMQGLMLHAGAQKLGRQDLLALPTPEGTETHTIIPHSKVVEAAIEALSYRRIEIVKDEYGVSRDGAKMFGVLTLDIDGSGINLVLGLRNSHDKSFSLGMVAGFRVFVCDNLAFKGEFFAVARKHTSRVMDRFPDKAPSDHRRLRQS